MTKGITFNSLKEAKEYAERMKKEGYKTDLRRLSGKVYKVTVIGKLSPKERATETPNGWTNSKAYQELKKVAYPFTPLSEVRKITKKYSQKHKVLIKISEKAFKDELYTDGYCERKSGKFTIYLHPIVQYYSPEDIKATLEHELGHLAVERSGWARARKGIEYRTGKPKPGYELIG